MSDAQPVYSTEDGDESFIMERDYSNMKAIADTLQIDEEVLRIAGFKWDQRDRQPTKHWLLWIGDARKDASNPEGRAFCSSDELGIELASSSCPGDEWWYCWIRCDFAGRYSRFLHVRHVAKWGDVIGIIEGLTGRQFNPTDVMYGQLWRPESAARHRKESKRLDLEIAKSRDRCIANHRGEDLSHRTTEPY